MRVLVTFALEAEFAPWRRMREFVRQEFGSAPLYQTNIGSAAVFAGITGIGSERARFIAGGFMKLQPAVCISSGLAGGLRAESHAGKILAAKQVHPLAGLGAVGSDPGLLDIAVRCGATRVHQFITSDHLVTTPAEKEELGLLGDAVEMESIAVMRAAEAQGVRRVAIRAVSDGPRDEMPAFLSGAVSPDGRVRLGPVISHVASHPGDLPKLVRLGIRSSEAANRLCSFLDDFIGTLAPEFRWDGVGMAMRVG